MKPFDFPFTPFHNWLLDYVMPNLSPNGWKVLCAAIRCTLGWTDEESPIGRKLWDEISYSQFQTRTGIGSMRTLSRAIKECLDNKYMLRRKVGTHQGTRRPIYAYSLNRNYEVSATETVVAAATETVVAAATETVVAAATETVVTKETKKQNKGVVGVQLQDRQTITLLTNFGVSENVAAELASQRTEEQIRDWLEYTKAATNLYDPIGFLVSKLKTGERVPHNRRKSSKERYLSGKYADLIQH